jgi:putative intracellular protease/amidase
MAKTIFQKLFLVIVVLGTVSQAIGQTRKVLIVSTNRDSVGLNRSGSYLPEIAYPFQYFTDQGFVVEIVTPKGGKAAIYDKGTLPETLDRIAKSEPFIKATLGTLAPADVDPKQYVAVFYPGGHGQYFDVISDERIASITAAIYEQGGIIGTAGHGVASLIDVKLSDCSYLVSGKRITCFPHWAEQKWMNISQYGALLPFDMEEVLRRRGANLIIPAPETASNPDLTLVADQRNRVVTGSFASSAQWVAEQMTVLLKSVH